MEENEGMNLMIPGMILAGVIGPVVCLTPVAPLGGLLMVVGMIMMVFSGGSAGYHYPVSHTDSHDQHYHLHQHNYPKYTEAREYSVSHSDGTTHSVRQLRRAE